MAYDNIRNQISRVADADLSYYSWRAVKQSATAGQCSAFAASTDIPLGILQDGDVTGEPVGIVPIGSGGSSQIELAEVIAGGALAAADADGCAVAAAAGSYTLGLMEVGGNTGDLGQILLNNLIVKA